MRRSWLGIFFRGLIAVAAATACAAAGLTASVLAAPPAAAAAGAVLPGFDSQTFGPNDDLSTGVTFPFAIGFFGQQYTAASLNNNGNLTFGQSLGTYTPYPLSDQGPAMIAAFFADVDTRVGNTVTYGSGTVDGHPAFGVNWPAVGCYNENDSVRNTFQLLLVSRPDIAPGDFDIEFNYNQIQWDSGQASGGDAACLNGTAARAGYASGSGATGTYYELPGSGANNAFLDSNSATGLVNNSYGSTQPGRYIYPIRNGIPGLTSGAPVNATGVGSGSAAVSDPTCNTANPVNCASGDFWHTFTDFSIPERGGPLAVTRTYNSLRAGDGGPFGYGWTWSLGDRLVVNADRSATLTAGDGSAVTAEPSGGSSYVLPTWADSTLSADAGGGWRFTRHQRTIETFNSSGLLMSVADLNGDTTTLAYQNGQLEKITDPAGRVILVQTDSAGRIVALTDPMGRSVRYAYDAAGNLATATDRQGRVTSFRYDADHQLLTMTDPEGGTLTNDYDASGRVVQQADPLGRITRFSYTGSNFSAAGGTTTETGPDGDVTTQQYLNGELAAVTRGVGTAVAATTRYAYDPVSLGVTAMTDPRGNITTASYDASGDLLSRTDPLGRNTAFTYDALGDVLTETSPAGRTTAFTYDAHGNVLTVTDPAGHVTAYRHSSAVYPGDVTTVTDADGRQTGYAYDRAGDLASVTTAPRPGVTDVTQYGYDRDGERTCQASANATAAGVSCRDLRGLLVLGTSRDTYDRDGEVVTAADLSGAVTRYAYDGNGNQVQVIDPAGRVTASRYDADSELIKVTRPDGTTLAYAYDGDGSQLSRTNGAGRTTRYAYDALDRETASTDPLGRETRFGYDLDGNLATRTDPANRVTAYGYNAASQLVRITYSDGTTPDVTYAYDADGNRVSMTDGTGSTSYGYDELDRLTSQTNGAGAMVRYAYDNAGQITSLTYPSGKAVTETYDGAGELAAVTDWLGQRFTFGYDHDGNEVSQSDPAGVAARYRYNADDQVVSVTDAARWGVVARYSYGRDRLGQVTSAFSAGAGASPAEDYRYDALGQVISDSVGWYGYDAAGDLTGRAGGITQTFDAAGELVASAGPAGSSHAGTRSRVTLSYDASGDRTGMTPALGPATQLTYDQADRLTGYGSSATYAYDGDGLRAEKDVHGMQTAFTWDETGTVPLLLTAGRDSYVYGPGDLPLEQITGTTPTYLLHDQQGSTRLLVSSRGIATGSYAYGTYGVTTRHAGPASTSLQFDGQYTDAESGFQYLQARYYDPATGVFLTTDPMAQITASPYAFAFGTPVNAGDLNGLCGLVCGAVGAFGGAIVGAVGSAVTYAAENQGSFSLQDYAAAVAGGAVNGAVTGGCDGFTDLTVSVVCGSVGGALGEVTTEWIAGNGYDGSAIEEEAITGGVFGGLDHFTPELLPGDHYAPSDEAFNDVVNDIPGEITEDAIRHEFAPQPAC
jgi:RHS repeat-associated protein